MGKAVRVFTWGVCIVLVVVVLYGGYLYQATVKPFNSQDNTVINYTIEPGTTTKKVNRQLAAFGLIKHPKMADLLVRLHDWSHIQAGEYELTPSMTLEQM